MNATTTIKIKEVDRFKSLNHKGRMVSEFIIYTMADDTIVSAMTMIETESNVNKVLAQILRPNIDKINIPYENK